MVCVCVCACMRARVVLVIEVGDTSLRITLPIHVYGQFAR